jgi:hypothetical protein
MNPAMPMQQLIHAEWPPVHLASGLVWSYAIDFPWHYLLACSITT